MGEKIMTPDLKGKIFEFYEAELIDRKGFTKYISVEHPYPFVIYIASLPPVNIDSCENESPDRAITEKVEFHFVGRIGHKLEYREV